MQWSGVLARGTNHLKSVEITFTRVSTWGHSLFYEREVITQRNIETKAETSRIRVRGAGAQSNSQCCVRDVGGHSDLSTILGCCRVDVLMRR
jgi:hypothetical protein